MQKQKQQKDPFLKNKNQGLPEQKSEEHKQIQISI